MKAEDWKKLPDTVGTEVYRTQVGSGVHGVTVEDDDRDEMGICIEKPEYVIGLHRFEQWEWRTKAQGVRSGPGDLDLVVYSLRKWARLALAGNPTVLIPLFVPIEDVVVDSDVAMDLRQYPKRWLSKLVADRFIGYMRGQREQLLGLRSKKHTNRPELIKEFGFDTKFAYHMVRLGIQGCELLSTERISLPMREDNAYWLRDLRAGKHTKEEAIDWASYLERRLYKLRETSYLPEEPDYDWANAWLIRTYQRVWKDEK